MAQSGKTVSELIDMGSKPVIRHLAPYHTPADDLATFALLRAPKATAPATTSLTPTFIRGTDGKHTMTVSVAPGTSLYGTGQVTGPLLRDGREIVLWNTDAPGYRPDAPSLYQTHPWVLGVRADGTAFGVLFDTTFRAQLSLDGQIKLVAEGNVPPVYTIERSSPQEVSTALAELTGTMPMPPRWTLGYQQCRWSYFPESRVREIASEFRKRSIPANVMWMDIDYMDQFRVFTFDAARFADPTKLNADLESQGFKAVWMINPGIADLPGYFVRDELLGLKSIDPKAGGAVMAANGDAYRGGVWPGPCVFPDFTNDKVRQWWAGLYKNFMSTGIDGVWNDMNEPAVFETESKTMPEDTLHRGGLYQSFPDQPQQTVTAGNHARFHNVYGMLMAQGTFEGILGTNPQNRPFVLTRANFIGGHRYAATWTGDNSATWNDLEQSIPMILSLGLSGQPFVGPDTGGFAGNGPKDEVERADMFARWMGIGTFFPFYRGHTARGNIDKEPWAFGADTEKASKLAIERRMVLLPYLYTLFHEASTTGVPIMRPLFYADPKDVSLRSEDDAFLFGDYVLVAPQLMPDRSRTLAMPKGIWRPFDVITGQHVALPMMYLKGGSIIATGPLMQYEWERPLDSLTLHVALDEAGKASGTLYEDAGDGFEYKQGDYLLTTYTAAALNGQITVNISKAEGKRQRISRPVTVVIHGAGGVTTLTGTDGQPISGKFTP